MLWPDLGAEAKENSWEKVEKRQHFWGLGDLKPKLKPAQCQTAERVLSHVIICNAPRVAVIPSDSEESALLLTIKQSADSSRERAALGMTTTWSRV